VHDCAGALRVALELPEIDVEARQRVVAMSRPARRSVPRTPAAPPDARPPGDEAGGTSANAAAGAVSSAAAAFASKRDCVPCPSAPSRGRLRDGRLAHFAGENLGDVPATDARPLPRQLARNVDQAAKLAG
jgi:hypothetical protein